MNQQNNNDTQVEAIEATDVFVDSMVDFHRETAEDDKLVRILSQPSIKIAIKAMAKSPLLGDIKGDDNAKYSEAISRIVHGVPLGLPPLYAIQNICCIKGKYTIWGDAAIALVKSSGQCEYLTEEWEGEGDDLTCITKTKRKGELREVVSTFSVGDAKAAGLLNSYTYKQYKKRMIFIRSRAFLIRNVYADIIGGMYFAEEMEGSNPAGQIANVGGANNVVEDMKQEKVVNAEFSDSSEAVEELISRMEREESIDLRNAIYDAGDGSNLTGADMTKDASPEQVTKVQGLLGI